LLCLGVRRSSAFNGVIVVIKLAVIALVIVAGISYIHTGNYHPFVPPSGATPASGGSSGSTVLQDLGAARSATGRSASSPHSGSAPFWTSPPRS
jgi:APA family basic amino acid/polyamine antiporter